MLNELAPYRIFNAITQKEKWLVDKLWPEMKRRLEERFQTEFNLDEDFNIYYDNEKATKNEVLTVTGTVFMDYYNSRLKI